MSEEPTSTDPGESIASTSERTSDHRNSDEIPTDIPLKTHPTLRPTMIWLVMVMVAGVVAFIFIQSNPSLVGGGEAATLFSQAIALLTFIGLLRFVIRIFILTRTSYIVNDHSIARQYEILYRTWRRDVPLSLVRSHELDQSRIQKLLGYGTITLNQGLGTIRLENVPNPYSLYDTIGRQIIELHSR